jgi:hypothetical protein
VTALVSWIVTWLVQWSVHMSDKTLLPLASYPFLP